MHRMLPSDHVVSVSCITVGIGLGGCTSMLARVALTDFKGQIILDCYVAPTFPVTDYRYKVTGITAADLANASEFSQVQRRVADIIRNKTIVGHQLWNDLSVLGICHPAVYTRDVALYQPYRYALNSPHSIVRLQTLCWHLMRRRCQDGQQNPIENARVALDLYRSHTEWEGEIRNGRWPCDLPPWTSMRFYL